MIFWSKKFLEKNNENINKKWEVEKIKEIKENKETYDWVLTWVAEKFSGLDKNNFSEELEKIKKEIKKKYPSKNNSTIQKDVEELLPDELYNHLVYLEDLKFFKWLKNKSWSEKEILSEVKNLFSDSEYSSKEMAKLLFDAWIFNKKWFKSGLINDDSGFDKLQSILDWDGFDLADFLEKIINLNHNYERKKSKKKRFGE